MRNYIDFTAGWMDSGVDDMQCLHFLSGWVLLYCEIWFWIATHWELGTQITKMTNTQYKTMLELLVYMKSSK